MVKQTNRVEFSLNVSGALKMREYKMQEWKMQE